MIRSHDFAHRFRMPDFSVRADCVAGREVEIGFTPDKAGRFGSVGDKFRGEGHDEMNGLPIVTSV